MAPMPLESPSAEEAAAHIGAKPSDADAPACDVSTAPSWIYSVGVRELCEFTAKRGDLDRRFTPSATALEGLMGQGTVAQRRGADYETEIALETQCGPLRVRGRADGHDPRRHCLEEIKTIRGSPDDIPENRRQLHWAQLQTYGALFCRVRKVSEIALALVYFDAASQSEVELRQLFGADELEQLFAERCAAFIDWARQEAAHRAARDAALQALAFPEPSFRAGQRDLAEAVYRAAAHGRCLVAQAPTGIGKTVGTLFPMLKAMPLHGIDKLAYLTCKGTGRITALDALSGLRAGAACQLRVLTLVPKDEGCEHPDKACHGQACPLAAGFYDRLPGARQDAVALGWLDAAAQRDIALRYGICPYYLGQELVRWADVLVGDVHHLFDSNGLLWGLMQALDWNLAVLVDEAHNLVERARRMYSAELHIGQLRTAAGAAPIAVRGALDALTQVTEELVADTAAPYAVLPAAPDSFVQALQAAAGAMSEHFNQHPLSVGSLLDFHFDLQRFLKLVEALSDHSLFDVQTVRGNGGSKMDQDAGGPTHGNGRDTALCVRNVAPACFLRQRFKALHSVTLFSATLSPPEYAIQLLGLPEDSAWIDVPPAFPAEHLSVRVADGISTRFVHRQRSLQRLVAVIAQQFDRTPGNHLAFFSSFDYLDQAAGRLAALRPDIPQWRQERRMGAEARADFLSCFRPQGRGIGFAVLGGVFAEGVDLPGSLLIGAFIATLGLPPVSVTQDHIQQRLDKLFGPDHGYADLVPAMQRVVQAAGRILRTPEDRGCLWLLDDRYRRPDVVALLPAWWQLGPLPAAVPQGGGMPAG
jgi:Rad3-related DNA helicase